MIRREKMIDKIRALLSKTVEAGCSEAEAMAALSKARAMMDAYEVTEEDLKLTKEIAAILKEDGGIDPNGVKSQLAMSISEFCDCKVWRGKNGLVFCGLPSDVDLATHMIDTLSTFVLGELANYLATCLAPKSDRRRIINGFVFGCTGRIAERLRELIASSKKVATRNGTALVIVKSGAIIDAMKAAGINLGKPRRSSRRSDAGSYAAGRIAGERAGFGRPLGSHQTALLS